MYQIQGKTQSTGTLEYYEDLSLEDLQQVIRMHPPKLDSYGTFFRLPRSQSAYTKCQPMYLYAAYARGR